MIILIVPRSTRTPGKQLVLPRIRALHGLLSGHYATLYYAPRQLTTALRTLIMPPSLVVASSRIFSRIRTRYPLRAHLASFSILFTHCGKSVHRFITNTGILQGLQPSTHILVTRTYTRIPRRRSVKQIGLPQLLRQGLNSKLGVSVISNCSFPRSLSSCSLIVRYNTYVFAHHRILGHLHHTHTRSIPIAGCNVTVTTLANVLSGIRVPVGS